jgi:hypothetical protein
MSKPLHANPEHRLGSMEFHRAVFAAHGHECYFRTHRKLKVSRFDTTLVKREPHEKCEVTATDAMHIIPRSQISAKHLRFAEPEANGRPGCHTCHMLQEKWRLEFSFKDRHAAWAKLNPLNKVPLPEPIP